MNNLYSLLTAINTYHPDSGVTSLSDCHNDLHSWQSFLEDRFPRERLNIQPLLDGDATYQNVVHHFVGAFLGWAQVGDTVLLFSPNLQLAKAT
jgi:hypothetical protein